MQKLPKQINFSFPVTWKLSLLVKIILTSVSTDLQSQTLPADSILYNSMYDFYQEELLAELKVFQVKENNKWVKYLPSIGVTYTIDGKPRPMLNYNPLSIMRVKEESQLRELSREGVVLKYQNLISSKMIELENLILDFRLDVGLLNSELEILAIDEKLMTLNEEKYRANLIKPSTYLQEKKKYLVNQKQLNHMRNELEKSVNRIYNIAKISRSTIEL